MQEDWPSSPGASASSSADVIAAAVDRLSHAVEKLQQQMDAQYQITKTLTDKIDQMSPQMNVNRPAMTANVHANPVGLPPNPYFQSPRRNEVRFQLAGSSQHDLVYQTPKSAQHKPMRLQSPSQESEQRLPYKSPVSMFHGHHISSPILPAADSSIDLSMLASMSTPSRNFPDSLPLEDIDITKYEEDDDDGDEDQEKTTAEPAECGTCRRRRNIMTSRLDASDSRTFESLSMLELSQDTIFPAAPTIHRKAPDYELWSPSHAHIQLLSPFPQTDSTAGLQSSRWSKLANAASLRDSSFWKRRLHHTTYGGDFTSFV